MDHQKVFREYAENVTDQKDNYVLSNFRKHKQALLG